MTRNRIHVRLVALGGIVTGALTVVWALGYALASGEVPLVPLVLGPAVGILTALGAALLSGHPVGAEPQDPPASFDDRPPAVPARGAR